MKPLVLQPTDVAQWHALVAEAQSVCHLNLDEVIESYLVFLLMRFAGRADLSARVMALEFLHAQQRDARQPDRLRDVGDHCLLFSGLFPQLAESRLVRVSYFIRIGRSAYHQLGLLLDRERDQLYSRLADAFVAVMDVLHAMRGLGGEPVLAPLAAAELWSDTGSRGAYHELLGQCNGVPVATRQSQRHRH
jgi:hypothetical protein